MTSLSLSFDPTVPYNTLPDLPPAGFHAADLLRETVEARSALSELKGYCRTLPNPALLLNAVVLHEGMDSSEIENIVTTQDEVFRAAATPDAGSAGSAVPAPVKEVLRYREAVHVGLADLRATGLLRANTLVRIVQCLKHTTAGVRRHPAALANPATKRVIYTPPEGEALLWDKLGALERFMHEDEGFDPLVRMALAHYQFEAVHPFADGNGRTGRIMNVLYLIQQGLLEHPVLYLSAYVLAHRAEYYARLRAVTERGEWAEWVAYVLEAVRATSSATLGLIQGVNELAAEFAQTARAGMRAGYSRELVELLFTQPYCKIGTVVEAGLAQRLTASRYLADLERLGLVRLVQVHRDKYFVNARLLDLLAAFRP